MRDGESYERAKRRGVNDSVREDSGNLREQVVHNLPTPRASNYMSGTSDRGVGTQDDYNLETVAARLVTLPTPLSTDYNTPASEWDTNNDRFQLRDINALLPTLPTPRGQARQNIYNREEYHFNLEEALATLPTPTARDYKDQSFSPRVLDGRSHGELPDVVGQNFLPTPVAGDGTKASTNPDTSARRIAAGRQAFLTDIVQTQFNRVEIAWGKYEPAITRWESITRPVPEPTVPYKEKRRLNPEFVEWMMGLSAGWVTGHGLSAAKELKMLGNGVCPQQAHAAISALMERTCQS